MQSQKAGVGSERENGRQLLKRTLAPALERLTAAIALAIAALFSFFKIAHETGEADTRRLDAAVSHFFQTQQTPAFHAAAAFFSWLAGPIGIPATVGLSVFGFWKARRFWPDGFTMLIAGLGGWGLMEGLKALFPRARPDSTFANLGSSFPSGHAFFALTVYGLLAYWLTREASPRRRRFIWGGIGTLVILVGFSRVFLGAHYPSDVLAGFAVAVPWLWGCLALSALFRRKSPDV